MAFSNANHPFGALEYAPHARFCVRSVIPILRPKREPVLHKMENGLSRNAPDQSRMNLYTNAAAAAPSRGPAK
ncbi:MAG: hypothetical protein HFACDABA_02214 [Anaerolineales bacterium]|nr:hypothetical protein [Anaerolineales bacterium]